MLIPSIDLLGGRVVQLEQGERLAYASNDLDGWLARFSGAPIIQVIDLDAAMGRGNNRTLVHRICRERACQVGGGIRTVEDGRALLMSGARRVIVGSALYDDRGVNAQRAKTFADVLGAHTLIAAVDSRAGRVVTHGWQTTLEITPAEAMRNLEPYMGGFLYTDVDREGLLAGLNMSAVVALHRTTSRSFLAAGGIRHRDEIEALHALGVDAVVGMALYREVIGFE